ncbi:MAG: histidine kinase [Cellvibrionaceae bacterium]|nr:histidine kinase [Cellvibrionaceae bacterium]
MIPTTRKLEAGVFEALQIQGDFLPDLKSAPVLLAIFLVSELLAITLAIAHYGVAAFDWAGLGLISISVQWVVLASLLIIAGLRRWLNKRSAAMAGLSCFAIVQSITLIFSYIALVNYGEVLGLTWPNVVDNLLISAIFSGIGLRYMYLQQQVRNQQQAHLKSQLQALQSRIQPHFLFNCMNTIASLIEIDPLKAERAVEDLSELFRASLAEPRLVPVADEMALCERYLGIEKLRMGERLQIAWAIDDEAKQAPIPSLILQPLLENAIKHGVQPLPDGGTIEVTVLIRDEQLHLTVANPVADGVSVKGHQLALNNVLARLQGHFGEQFAWEIDSRAGRYEINIHYGLKNF